MSHVTKWDLGKARLHETSIPSAIPFATDTPVVEASWQMHHRFVSLIERRIVRGTGG